MRQLFSLLSFLFSCDLQAFFLFFHCFSLSSLRSLVDVPLPNPILCPVFLQVVCPTICSFLLQQDWNLTLGTDWVQLNSSVKIIIKAQNSFTNIIARVQFAKNFSNIRFWVPVNPSRELRLSICNLAPPITNGYRSVLSHSSSLNTYL